MAKFCTKCGKELKDGEKCSCQDKKENKTTKEVKSANTNVEAKDLFNKTVEILKSYVKKPVDTINNNIKDSTFTIAIIFAIIFGISGGIFLLTLIKESYSSIAGVLMPMTMMGNALEGAEIPYFKIFLYALIVFTGIIFLESLIAYLISNKMLKSDISYKKTLSVFAFSTISASIFLLASTLFNFISIKLSLILVSAGSMLYHYYLNVTATKHFGVDKNRVQYVIVVTCILTSFIVGFLAKELIG